MKYVVLIAVAASLGLLASSRASADHFATDYPPPANFGTAQWCRENQVQISAIGQANAATRWLAAYHEHCRGPKWRLK
jgi:hypothetical protein